MTIDDLVDLVRSWDGVLAFTPQPGDGSPEVALGDWFFYHAPDGKIPTTTQPFATIVTKDYPDDTMSLLDREGVFRLNVHPRSETFATWDAKAGDDLAALDRLFPHPVYGPLGWLSVLNPGPRTAGDAEALLREAYEAARNRFQRRRSRQDSPG